MEVVGAFNHLFRPGLRKDFRDRFQLWPTEYTQILKQEKMDRPEIEAVALTGPNRLFELGDMEEVSFDEARMGPKAVGVDRTFGAGFALGKKTVEDDQYGKANQAAKWLADAARYTYEFRVAGLLDDSTGALYNTLDGLPLISAVHTLFGSPTATMANTTVAPVGFSVTGINALLELAELGLNWNGDPMPMRLNKIIYSPKYIGKAKQIFGSELEPFTADNQVNQIRERIGGITQVVSHYKSNVESYFAIDDMLNDAWFLTRRALTFSDDFDFKTDAALYKATCRILVWVYDFHGWFGAFPV